MLKRITSLLLLATFFLLGNGLANAVTLDFKSITEPEKKWTVTFNDAVSERADLNSIYILSTDNVKHLVSITISANPKQIIVEPTKPYLIGSDYTLVIPKGFESAKGSKLKEDVTMPFTLQGTYIEAVSANWNSLVTNIIVQASTTVTSVKVSVQGKSEITLNGSVNQFSKGTRDLSPGDTLIILAYDAQNALLETQHYKVK